MKFKFHNIELEDSLVPDYPFVAADRCGAVYAYKEEPHLVDCMHAWSASGNVHGDMLGGDYVYIDDVNMRKLNVGWSDSLTEIKND